MNHFETKKSSVGIILAIGLTVLTGCTQFQTSLASPGSSSNNSGDAGITSQGTGNQIHRAGLASSSAQIAQDVIDAIRNFSPTSGAASCDLTGNCTFAVAPEIQIPPYFTVSSQQFTDDRGNSIGGGYSFAISILNATATFSEPGVHIVNTSSTGFDFASRTVSPLSVAANVSDMTFTVNGGALELIDNRNHYVATVAADNVTFDSSCKCPISGSFSGNLSGTFAGIIDITFNSCGSISITAAGNTSTASVSSCQL